MRLLSITSRLLLHIKLIFFIAITNFGEIVKILVSAKFRNVSNFVNNEFENST